MDIDQGLTKLVVQCKGQILTVFITAVVALLFQRRYRKGLYSIPGPFLASILPLDRVLTVAYGHQYLTHLNYHKKYGPRVRVGPYHVSFSDASVIPQIYGITTKFYKVCHSGLHRTSY